MTATRVHSKADEDTFRSRVSKQVVSGDNESLFESVVNFIAFPEKHLAMCPDTTPIEKEEKGYDEYYSMEEGRDEVEMLIFEHSEKEGSVSGRSAIETMMGTMSFPMNLASFQNGNASRTFEKVMDTVAFPENHLVCPSVPSYTAPSFEKVMDTVAFPEKHLVCPTVPSYTTPSLKERGNTMLKAGNGIFNRAAETGAVSESSMTQEENIPRALSSQSTFEKVMDTVAFPEKHLTVEKTINPFLDCVVYPEKYIACPNGLSKHHGRPDAAKISTRANKDLLDDVFERAEEEHCVRMTNVGNKHDVLDFVFENVESTVCDRDIEGDYLLIERSNLPQKAGFLVVQDERDRNLAIAENSDKGAGFADRKSSVSDLPQNASFLTVQDERDRNLAIAENSDKGAGFADRKSSVSNGGESCLQQVSNAVQNECGDDGLSYSDAGDYALLTNTREDIDSPRDLTIPSLHDMYAGVNRDRSLISESSLSSMSVSHALKMDDESVREQNMSLAPQTNARRPNHLTKFLGGGQSTRSDASFSSMSASRPPKLDDESAREQNMTLEPQTNSRRQRKKGKKISFWPRRSKKKNFYVVQKK